MEPAGRGQRLIAALIDGALSAGPYLLVTSGSDASRLGGIALFLALVVVQCVLLARDGQTIGKRLLKARIVRVDTDENGGFVTNVLMRSLVASIPNILGLYWLADCLFIFREDRRCLHDRIAGTKVVRVEPGIP